MKQPLAHRPGVGRVKDRQRSQAGYSAIRKDWCRHCDQSSIGQRLDFIGGALRIDSQLGKGTVVTVKLPTKPGVVAGKNSNETAMFLADAQAVCAVSRAEQRDRFQLVDVPVVAQSQPVAVAVRRGSH